MRARQAREHAAFHIGAFTLLLLSCTGIMREGVDEPAPRIPGAAAGVALSIALIWLSRSAMRVAIFAPPSFSANCVPDKRACDDFTLTCFDQAASMTQSHFGALPVLILECTAQPACSAQNLEICLARPTHYSQLTMQVPIEWPWLPG